MLIKLFALFVIVPLVELFLLARIGTAIGWSETFALVLFTGLAGAWLAKREGLSALASIRKAVGEGRVPTLELLDGAMILASGLLLVTPGVLTDAAGFLLLIPPARAHFRAAFAKWLKGRIRMGAVSEDDGGGGGSQARVREQEVIDVKAESVRDVDP